jgi:hypothetical protein
VFKGQAQRGGAQGFSGGELLALADPAVLVHRHASSMEEKMRAHILCKVGFSTLGR